MYENFSVVAKGFFFILCYAPNLCVALGTSIKSCYVNVVYSVLETSSLFEILKYYTKSVLECFTNQLNPKKN